MPAPLRVAVVGGGVSGLVVAHRLVAGRPDGPPDGTVAVTVLEAGARFGGKVSGQPMAGTVVDAGPDALLLRDEAVRSLLIELDLVDAISRAASRRAYVWARDALRPLPAMSLFGVPDNPFPLIRTGILSLPGAVRAAADLVLPRRRAAADPTIAELVRPRLGREVHDLLVEPMLGGVHAGRADELSARSAVPDVFRAVSGKRSVYLALRERRRRAPAGAPSPGAPGGSSAGSSVGSPERPDRLAPGMITFRGGLSRLPDALVAAMPGADLRTRAEVVALDRGPGGSWTLGLANGDRVPADVVVLAAPAGISARLLRPHACAAADALDAVPYADVATVSLAYRRRDVGRPLDGTGFLVPPCDGRTIVGCTWTSAKWEHHVASAPASGGVGDLVLLRCAVGRHRDIRWRSLSDTAIVDAVHAELVATMGLRDRPVEAHVRRWPGAMPQYVVGHAERVATVDAELAGLPGLHVTGAAQRGVGLASCISAGEALARTLLDTGTVRRPDSRGGLMTAHTR